MIPNKSKGQKMDGSKAVHHLPLQHAKNLSSVLDLSLPSSLITLATHLISAKDFFTCPLILPKDSENIDGLKFFAPPPKDASEIFRPPLRDVSENYHPPLT